MPTTFHKLCMDTTSVDPTLGRFWAVATGCEYRPGRSGTDPGDVIGVEPGMEIALCLVPEAKTVKHRVHLDVHTDSVDTLLAAGAPRSP